MKNNTKKLTLAICLLLISATLLGTASFAWFTMNTEVDVDGIEVEAYSDALFLQISNNGSTYSTSTTFTETKKTMRLVAPVSVDLSNLWTLTPEAATGAFDDTVDYYKKGDATSADDTYAADNYIKVDLTDGTTKLDTYYKIEFERITEAAKSETGVKYYEKLDNGNGYKEFTVTYEDAVLGTEAQSVFGLWRAYSYTVTDDTDFVAGTDYYQLNADREFEVAVVTPGSAIPTDDVYFEKVANIVELGTGAGVYTDADDDRDIAYYTTDTAGNYVIATGLVPTEKTVEGFYTFELTDAIVAADETAIAAGAKAWWLNDNGDYICVYENTGTAAADISDKDIFWGKLYSDELDNVGATDMEAADVGIIKEDALESYVHSDTLYIRQSLNTVDASNLRIENIEVSGRANALSAALRILFVATNGAGETKTYTYDNGVGFTASETLFATLLGNEEETVTVQTYIYFDGTDDVALTSETIPAGELNGQKIAIEFAIDEHDYYPVTP